MKVRGELSKIETFALSVQLKPRNKMSFEDIQLFLPPLLEQLQMAAKSRKKRIIWTSFKMSHHIELNDSREAVSHFFVNVKGV